MRTRYVKPRTKDHLLDEPKIEIVKAAVKTEQEKFLLWILLYTGLRISEFTHMKDTWIDWNKQLIKIPESQTCYCYECIKKDNTWHPKTKRAARAIPIVPEIKQQLQEYFQEHKDIMELISDRIMAYKLIQKVSKRAKIKLFPHCLRGTFATMLATKNFNVFEIQDCLGWNNPKTAAEYIRLSGAQVSKAFNEKW